MDRNIMWNRPGAPDYIIVNDRLENAVENILELIYRHRRHLREGTPDDPSKLD